MLSYPRVVPADGKTRKRAVKLSQLLYNFQGEMILHLHSISKFNQKHIHLWFTCDNSRQTPTSVQISYQNNLYYLTNQFRGSFFKTAKKKLPSNYNCLSPKKYTTSEGETDPVIWLGLDAGHWLFI